MLPFDVKSALISSLKKCLNKCLTSGSGHIVYLALFGSVFWAIVIFKKVPFCILHRLGRIFLATVIFKRCHFVTYTAWVGFFWPQSFLKGAMLYLALLGSDFFGHSHF